MLNLLSLQIEPELLSELKTAVDQLTKAIDKLPKDLPAAGRSRQNMGQASRGYVQDALTAAMSHPEVIPALIDIAEMQKDLDCVAQLEPILAVVSPATATLINLRSLAGQDLMNAANAIKKNFNVAAKNDPKFKAISDNLDKRYEKARKEKTSTEKSPT